MQGQKLAQRLISEQVGVVVFSTNPTFPRLLKFSENIKGLRTFFRLGVYLWGLRRLKAVNVVHVLAASHFFFFASVLPALIISKYFKKKVILNYRGGEADVFFSKYRSLISPCLKLANRVVVPSQFLAEIFEKHFKLEVDILPNLADFELFHFRQRTSFCPNLVVARSLEPIYDHRTLLKGFSLIKNKYPQATLQVAGEGSLKEELKSLVKKLGLEQNVHFLGSLSPTNLSEIYAQSDIMVNASTIDNFPGALLEAFICGLPVVSSAVGGIPLMVKDHFSGLLFTAGDPEALAENVDFILTHPEHAQKFAIEANNFAQQYSWSEVREKLFLFYDLESQKI